MGAEKWLDIELWSTPRECFEVLKSRGYRIATTHVGMDAVLIIFPSLVALTKILVFRINLSCIRLHFTLKSDVNSDGQNKILSKHMVIDDQSSKILSQDTYITDYLQVSIYDMDWSRPTAIVVGNENR